MKMPDIGNSILVQPSDYMLPAGWMAYDANNNIVEVGSLGSVGSCIDGNNSVVTRIVCGRQFYDDLRKFIANQTRQGERDANA